MARPKKAKVLYDEDLGWYNEKTGVEMSTNF